MQGSRLAPARPVRLAEDRSAVLLATSMTSKHIAASCASESRARACPSQRAYPPLRSRAALRWSIPIWISRALGTVSAQLFVVHSPRHELRLRNLVSFRDVRHLSLFHSVYDLNSLRDLLDVRHPFLYCWFISLNCTCVGLSR